MLFRSPNEFLAEQACCGASVWLLFGSSWFFRKCGCGRLILDWSWSTSCGASHFDSWIDREWTRMDANPDGARLCWKPAAAHTNLLRLDFDAAALPFVSQVHRQPADALGASAFRHGCIKLSSSPHEERVGRGLRREAANQIIPPLPTLLLHPMEEREFDATMLFRWDTCTNLAEFVTPG